MYHLLLSALCVALWQSAIAQNSYPLVGARVNGVGYAVTCIDDQWSVFNNIAGLTGVTELRVGAAYDAVPGFPTFNRMAAVAATPLRKNAAMGLGFFRFGDDLYREQLLNLGYANKFGLASLGIRASLIQYHAEGFGSKSIFSVSAGGLAEITPWLRAGAAIINAVQPEVTEDERLTTMLLAGLSIQSSEQAIVFVEAEHELGFRPVFKAGLEYTIHKKFIARTGLNLRPYTGFFGFGFRHRKMQLDYAWSYAPDFVSRHQFSVLYLFTQRQ